MSDVKEMWNSPWRTLQKNLANGFAIEESNPWDCGSAFPGSAQAPRNAQVPSTTALSWLVRARSRKVRVARIIHKCDLEPAPQVALRPVRSAA
jgi:hypothetical protein